MRKLVSILLIVIGLFSLTGCKSGLKNDYFENNEKNNLYEIAETISLAQSELNRFYYFGPVHVNTTREPMFLWDMTYLRSDQKTNKQADNRWFYNLEEVFEAEGCLSRIQRILNRYNEENVPIKEGRVYTLNNTLSTENLEFFVEGNDLYIEIQYNSDEITGSEKVLYMDNVLQYEFIREDEEGIIQFIYVKVELSSFVSYYMDDERIIYNENNFLGNEILQYEVESNDLRNIAYYNAHNSELYECTDCDNNGIIYSRYDLNQIEYSFDISTLDKISYNLHFAFGWDKFIHENEKANLFFKEDIIIEDIPIIFYNAGQFFIEQEMNYNEITEEELSLNHLGLSFNISKEDIDSILDFTFDPLLTNRDLEHSYEDMRDYIITNISFK